MNNVFECCCKEMLDNIQETACVNYNERFNEFTIACNDGTRSGVCLFFCPWCGKKLPESKRKRWFEHLEKMGFDAPLFCEDIPEKYKTAEWWRDQPETNQGTVL